VTIVDRAPYDQMVLLAHELLLRGERDYWLVEPLREDRVAGLVALEAQHFLLQRAAHDLGSPSYFSAPKRILEIECGSGPFVYAGLQQGHDVWGIDNDPDRIAIAQAKIDAYGLPVHWKERAAIGDAGALTFANDSFDAVLGWQVVEHLPDLTGSLYEAVRVTKRGGVLLFWASDYRGPFEAHYEIPWPPFCSDRLARRWLAAMGKPEGGIGSFFGITLQGVLATLEGLGCSVISGGYGPAFDPGLLRWFDLRDDAALERTAARFLEGMKAGTLPAAFTAAMSLAICVQKQ
jgi:SAM-dependent methyltransferase